MPTDVTENSKKRHLPEIPDEYWDAFNEVRNAHNATWAGTFRRFNNYQDWLDHLFNLPEESSNTAKLNAATVTYLLPKWLQNMQQNFLGDAEIPDIIEIENSVTAGTPGLVIAAGPSLLENHHLDMLHDSVFYREHKGVIVSTAHSLLSCLEAGVVPDYITMIDADEKMLNFIDHDIVDEFSDSIVGIFSMETHPSVLERWQGKKYFFLSIIPHATVPNVQTVLAHLFPKMTEIDCMSNCGSFSWNIARVIGCNPIALIGLDFSFKPDFPIKKTPYYNAYLPSYADEKTMIDKCYKFHTHSFFGNNCYTDFVHGDFCETTVNIFKLYKEEMGIITQNCTEGGMIDDPDVDSLWFKDWLAKWEQ